MKGDLRTIVKSYGLYAVLAAALIIAAAAAAEMRKSEDNTVIIYREGSQTDEDSKEDSSVKKDKTDKTSKTAAAKTTKKVTTTKKPKQTTIKTSKTTTSRTAKTTAEKTAKQTEDVIIIEFPIDINLVTFDELTAINGIGEHTAEDILAFRDSVGTIRYMEQLLEIPGIGESKLAMLSGYLYVDEADYIPPAQAQTAAPTKTEKTTASVQTTNTTKGTEKVTTVTEIPEEIPTETTATEPPERVPVNINEADAEEIAEKLLIDEELAGEIISTRELLGGKYENPLQLLYVKGINKQLLSELEEYLII